MKPNDFVPEVTRETTVERVTTTKYHVELTPEEVETILLRYFDLEDGKVTFNDSPQVGFLGATVRCRTVRTETIAGNTAD